MTAFQIPIQSRLKFWKRPQNDHYLLPDDGLRSDGIEEEIIFGQDKSDNQGKLDFSPISTSLMFDHKSPPPVGIEDEPILQKTRKNLRSDGLDPSNLDLLRNSVIEKELIAQMIRENLKADWQDSSSLEHRRHIAIKKESIVRSDVLDSSNLDHMRNSVIEKELITQMVRENLKPDWHESSNLDHQRNIVIEKESIAQKARKKLKSNELDSSNLDHMCNVLIENEPDAQKARKKLKPNLKPRHSSNLDHIRNSVIEKEIIAQKARKKLKSNGLDSSNLDLQHNILIEKELVAQLIGENLKPDGLDSSNLDHLRNIVIEKEPVVQKIRNLKSDGLDSSNLDLQRNAVIKKEPIDQKTRKNLKPRHSSNLDLPRNNIVKKEPITEKSRNNCKSGGFDSNLDLSRSTEENRPGSPATHLQLKVSLDHTSLPVESHLVIAAPLRRTADSSSLENRASSDPEDPIGTYMLNEYSDYVRRTANGNRLNRRGIRWRKKEVSPADRETNTRTKMKLRLPQIRSGRGRGDSKAPIKVNDKYGDNDGINSLAKTVAPMKRNAGVPAFHVNEGSACTRNRRVRRRGDSKAPVKVDDKYGDNDDMNSLAKTAAQMRSNAGVPAFPINEGSALMKNRSVRRRGDSKVPVKVVNKFGDNGVMNTTAKTTARKQSNAGAPACHDDEGSAFTRISLDSTAKAKSVRGSKRHPTAAAGQLQNAAVPSSRLKWLRPKRNDGKIVFSNNAGKEEEVVDFEEVSDCELNAIGISYINVIEGVDIWRPRCKHYVRRDKCTVF